VESRAKPVGKIADAPPEWNALTEKVIGAAMEVHTALGPGLLERLYENAMCRELTLRGVPYVRQAPVRVVYKGEEVGEQFLDLLVDGVLVLELKSVDRVHDAHLATLVSYLRSGGYPLGLLINFNVSRLKDGLYRRVHSVRTPLPVSLSRMDPAPRSSGVSVSSAYSEPPC
jgi:GxxExxY protein